MVGIRGISAEARVPGAIAVSIVLHVAGMGGFLYHSGKKAGEKVEVITDVELLIEQRAQRRAAMRAQPEPPSMKDFLKMALPKMPKVRVGGPLQVKAPEIKKSLMNIPQPELKDRGRLKDASKMNALDLSRERVKLAKVAQPLVDRETKALGALPKLAEIGTRKASRKVIQMAALAEERPERLRGRGLGAVSKDISSRNAPQLAAPLLAEQGGPKGRPSFEQVADMLAKKAPALKLEPEAARPKRLEKRAPVATAKLPPRETRAKLRQIKKKAVEIEGPLSNRKVVAHSLPEFPAWARDQGIIEAEVVIKFYVAPTGQVIESEMQVERTSGYGRLDRLAMEHLKKWRFEALPFGGRKEWGIITFRFVLE
ncbi:MAG: TonB family protein [Elusimicrobiota bacterium]